MSQELYNWACYFPMINISTAQDDQLIKLIEPKVKIYTILGKVFDNIPTKSLGKCRHFLNLDCTYEFRKVASLVDYDNCKSYANKYK